jgi:hypothetical protein
LASSGDRNSATRLLNSVPGIPAGGSKHTHRDRKAVRHRIVYTLYFELKNWGGGLAPALLLVGGFLERRQNEFAVSGQIKAAEIKRAEVHPVGAAADGSEADRQTAKSASNTSMLTAQCDGSVPLDDSRPPTARITWWIQFGKRSGPGVIHAGGGTQANRLVWSLTVIACGPALQASGLGAGGVCNHQLIFHHPMHLFVSIVVDGTASHKLHADAQTPPPQTGGG